MEERNENTVFNMGLATIYRLHGSITLYQEGMRTKDPNKMYDEAKVIYVELESEMEKEEKETKEKV